MRNITRFLITIAEENMKKTKKVNLDGQPFFLLTKILSLYLH